MSHQLSYLHSSTLTQIFSGLMRFDNHSRHFLLFSRLRDVLLDLIERSPAQFSELLQELVAFALDRVDNILANLGIDDAKRVRIFELGLDLFKLYVILSLIRKAFIQPNYTIHIRVEYSITSIDKLPDKLRELSEEMIRDGKYTMETELSETITIGPETRKRVVMSLNVQPEGYCKLPPIIDSTSVELLDLVKEYVKSGRIILVVLPNDSINYIPFVFKRIYPTEKTDEDKVTYNLSIICEIISLVRQIANVLEVPEETRRNLNLAINKVLEDLNKLIPHQLKIDQYIPQGYVYYEYDYIVSRDRIDLTFRDLNTNKVLRAYFETKDFENIRRIDNNLKELLRRLNVDFRFIGTKMFMLCRDIKCLDQLKDELRKLGFVIEER